MIRNLNQMTFQGFGTVPPERNQSAKYLREILFAVVET